MDVHTAARLCFGLGMVLAIVAATEWGGRWPVLAVAVFLEGLGGLFVVGV